VLALASFGFAIAACATVPPAATPGRPAPTLGFALADGSQLSTETTRGDVVVLAFFTTWCPASGAMLRAIDGIRVANRSAPGLTVLAIDEGDEPAEVAALVERLGVRARVAFDRGGAIATQLGLPTMPAVIVIDREGIVRHVHGGYHGEDDAVAITSEISALLATPRPPSEPSTAPVP
jgi:peroxiredoxin